MAKARYSVCTIVFTDDDEDYTNIVVVLREKGVKHNDIYKAGLKTLAEKYLNNSWFFNSNRV